MRGKLCFLIIILIMAFSVHAQDIYVPSYARDSHVPLYVPNNYYTPSYARDSYDSRHTSSFQSNEFSLDKINAQDWTAVQQSQNLFYVRIEGNELVVSQNTYRKQEISLKFNGGILHGINDEHRGGRLIFAPHGDYRNSYTIKQGNIIKSIFLINNRIYFYEVLLANKKNDNNQVSSAALYELKECDDGFFYRKVYQFKSAPYYITSADGSIVVLTRDALYELTGEGRWVQLINNAPWSIYGPTSFAVYNQENIFIGLRGGYLKVDVVNSKYSFYRYIEH